jgi:hypothetical protein
MHVDPCNRHLNIWESIWESNSQNESSLGNVTVHALTPFCTPESTRCDSWAFFLAHNLANPALVASLRLGLRHTRCHGWGVCSFQCT